MMSDPDAGRDGLAAPLRGRRDAVPSDVDLGRVWLGVAAQVWRRQPGWLELAAGRLLRSPGLARALVTTPSLLVGWITATAVVLVAGILAMPYWRLQIANFTSALVWAWVLLQLGDVVSKAVAWIWS